MVKTKQKGTNAERELIHMFWKKGIAAARIAGSGSMQLPLPDIIAGKNNNIVAIECKISKNDYVYLTKKEIYELEKFALIIGAMPIVAVKINTKGWFFCHTNSLIKTDKAHVFNIKHIDSGQNTLNFAKIVSFLNT